MTLRSWGKILFLKKNAGHLNPGVSFLIVFVTIHFFWATRHAIFFTSLFVVRWNIFEISFMIFMRFTFYSSTSFGEVVLNFQVLFLLKEKPFHPCGVSTWSWDIVVTATFFSYSSFFILSKAGCYYEDEHLCIYVVFLIYFLLINSWISQKSNDLI